MYAKSGSVAVKDQSHSDVFPSRSKTAPSKLIGTDSVEPTCRMEAAAGTNETSATVACTGPKIAESVETIFRIVAGGGSIVPLRIEAAYSHEILIFLLWVKSLGFDRALLLARALPSPWPETLAAYEVALVAKGSKVVFGWGEHCTDKRST